MNPCTSKIDSFFFNNQGSFSNLGMNGANIFSNNANKKKLDRRKEENANDHWGCTHLKSIPINKLINEINKGKKEADCS